MKNQEYLDNFVRGIKENLTSGPVCDAILKCKGWEKSMQQIIDGQNFLAITRGWQYTGLPFKFCPWCGKKIPKEMK